MKKPCKVDGCERGHSSHGFCMMHAARWKRNGDPGPAEMLVVRSDPPDPKRWTPESMGWAAGVLEGEGSFYCQVDKNAHPNLSVRAGMVDEDVLLELERILGGRVRGPYTYGTHKDTPFYQWAITTNDHAYAVMAALYSFMHSRRKGQIEAALATWHANRSDRAAA